MALNTCVMYFRMIVTMIVTLLSSRWILLALGEEDFGIYHLVAGLLSMLMFLNVTMASSSQRFISFALGRKDKELINDTFYFSCLMHLLVGLIIVAIIEVAGSLLMHTVLQVPDGKLHLAMFCLHCLAINTFIMVVSVPFNALLFSHENIIYVSIVQITEALLKLFIAIYLMRYAGERLKLYVVVLTLIHLVTAIMYALYCRLKYDESRLRFTKVSNKGLFKQFLSYSGWNLIGGMSSMLRTQGVSMLLNSFHGVVMNAAYGIATQVNGQLSFFSSSIVTATKPQIVKSEGEGNRQRSLSLSATTSKFTFLMLAMVAIPLIIEMPFVMKIWLKEVPEYAVSFTRLVLLMSVISQFSLGISLPIESVGNIKKLQCWVGGLHFIVLPAGYVLLKMGLPPESVLLFVIVEECIGIPMRMIIAKRVAGLVIPRFLRETMLPSFLTAVAVFAECLFVSHIMQEGWWRLISVSLLSAAATAGLAYGYALTKPERNKIDEIARKIKGKFHH